MAEQKPLSAEERAESIRDMICSCGQNNCPRVARMAMALRAAEEAALERAALKLEHLAYEIDVGDLLPIDSAQQLRDAADHVRALKEKP